MLPIFKYIRAKGIGERLDLSKKQLIAFSFEAVEPVKDVLKFLDLSGNYLHKDRKLTLAHLQKLLHLNTLNLSSNLLNAFPPEICYLEELEVLELGGNTLPRLPAEFERLQTLRRLSLAGSMLDAPSFAIVGQLAKLIDLDLSATELKPDDLPEQMACTDLQTLNVSRNHLERVPVAAVHLIELMTLDLSDNRIEVIPDEISEMLSLTALDVSKNLIKDLPDTLYGMRALRKLVFSNNKLRALSPAFGTMLRLEELICRGNLLTRFPTFEATACLLVLDLSHNGIGAVPASIGSLRKLQQLSLSSNYIKSVAVEIESCQELRRIDLSSNRLTEIPFEFAKLKQLEEVLLHNNPLHARYAPALAGVPAMRAVLAEIAACTDLPPVSARNEDLRLPRSPSRRLSLPGDAGGNQSARRQSLPAVFAHSASTTRGQAKVESSSAPPRGMHYSMSSVSVDHLPQAPAPLSPGVRLPPPGTDSQKPRPPTLKVSPSGGSPARQPVVTSVSAPPDLGDLIAAQGTAIRIVQPSDKTRLRAIR
eukprot:TRINITY_DN11556_c0_g2_i1.p1 TRINITY_DN11556_c0_g2~~TRINITY_DN11556_c0_g2_i1.p1  ORF type:complete len:535 (+),score=145.40 TRINITY_DN11556_c0_g2_i1:189-1793(+)